MEAGEPEALHLDRCGPGQPAPHATLARSVSATGLSALVSGLINRQLPGPGSRIVAQDLHYQGRVAVGDSVTVNLTLREKPAADSSVRLDCSIVNQRGETLLTGSSRVIAPTQRIAYREFTTPEVIIHQTDAFAQVLGRCQGLPPATCAVVRPCGLDVLSAHGLSAAARPDHSGAGGAGGAHPGAGGNRRHRPGLRRCDPDARDKAATGAGWSTLLVRRRKGGVSALGLTPLPSAAKSPSWISSPPCHVKPMISIRCKDMKWQIQEFPGY